MTRVVQSASMKTQQRFGSRRSMPEGGSRLWPHGAIQDQMPSDCRRAATARRTNGSKRDAKDGPVGRRGSITQSRSVANLGFKPMMHSNESEPALSDSGSAALLDLQDDEGWEDAEPEEEAVTLTCLFGQSQFSDVRSLLQHCRDKHDFDLARLRSKFGV